VEASILSSDMVDARVAPKGSLSTCRSRNRQLLDSGQGACIPCFAVRAQRTQLRQRNRPIAHESLKVSRLRSSHRAPGLGHSSRDLRTRPACGICRRVMIRGLKTTVRRAARLVFISNEIMEAAVTTSIPRATSPCGIPHPAQRAGIGAAGAAQSVVCWAGIRFDASSTTTRKK